MAPFPFEVKHRVDHVFEDTRTGDHAFLGDVSNNHQNNPAALGDTDQFLRRCPYLRNGARSGVQGIDKKGLDGIDYHQVWAVGDIKGGDDVAYGRGGGQFDRGLTEAQATGPQTQLIDRLLAGNIGAPGIL